MAKEDSSECPTITTSGSSEFFAIDPGQSSAFPSYSPHISGRPTMAKATKRMLEDASEGPPPKKIKLISKSEKKRKSEVAEPSQAPPGPSDEVDFPRGGGTSFTPVEVKTIRAEAQREANEDVFKVGGEYVSHTASTKK